MTDLPYTDDDLKAEAARQHLTLTENPDFMGIGERMQGTEIESLMPPEDADGAEGPHWDNALNQDQFNEAQLSIHDLILGAADVSEWAIDLGADDLEPMGHHLDIDGDGTPIVRVYFAFDPVMGEDMRLRLIEGVGVEINRQLKVAQAAPAITPETARHVLWIFGVGGYRPGAHTERLLNLIACADTVDEARIALAYPEETAAVRLAKHADTGTAQLQAIADTA